MHESKKITIPKALIKSDNYFLVFWNSALAQLKARKREIYRSILFLLHCRSAAMLIGVVLSGAASDGTIGLKAIKDHGGLTFAQDQETAAIGGMPESAVKAGVDDFIMSPDQIPSKILEIKTNFHQLNKEGQNIALQEFNTFYVLKGRLEI